MPTQEVSEVTPSICTTHLRVCKVNKGMTQGWAGDCLDIQIRTMGTTMPGAPVLGSRPWEKSPAHHSRSHSFDSEQMLLDSKAAMDLA